MEERLVNVKEFRSHFEGENSTGVNIDIPAGMSASRARLLDREVQYIASPGYRLRSLVFGRADSIEEYVKGRVSSGNIHVAGKHLDGYAGHIIGFGVAQPRIDRVSVPLFIPKWRPRRWRND